MSGHEARVMRLADRVADALAQVVDDQEANGQVVDRASQRVIAHGLIAKALDDERPGLVAAGNPIDEPDQEEALARAVLNRLTGFGRLQDLIDDPENQDIMINGYDNVWVVRRDGTKYRGPPAATSDEDLIEKVQAAARPSGSGGIHEKLWTPSSPFLDMNLPSGDRLHAVGWVCRRPTVTIRRHNYQLYRLAQLLPGTVSQAMYEFLKAAVAAKANMLIAGSTNAGKTTLLRCLLNELPPEERLITIEDSFELQLSRFPDLHQDLTEMEQREPNSEGEGGVEMANLVRNSLRMNPDRVIVGEIRGREGPAMLQAMSQGNKGSICTIHADSSGAVFSRLAEYLLEFSSGRGLRFISYRTANALDLLVHMERLPDGNRVITSIREVTGPNDRGDGIATNEIFAPDHTGRATFMIAPSGKLMGRLADAGLDASWLTPERGAWGVLS